MCRCSLWRCACTSGTFSGGQEHEERVSSLLACFQLVAHLVGFFIATKSFTLSILSAGLIGRISRSPRLVENVPQKLASRRPFKRRREFLIIHLNGMESAEMRRNERPSRCAIWSHQRNGHKEGGSLSFSRLKPEPSSVLLDQRTAQIQPQPRPTDPGGLRIVVAHEASKDARLLVERNADPTVLYPDFYRVISAIFSHCHDD